MVVSDNQAPVISDCLLDIVSEVAPGTCGNVVSWMEPTVTDNCSGSSVVQVIGQPSGTFSPAGVTTVSYIATDAEGLSSSCTFTVTIEDNEAAVISNCPADISLEAGTDCSDVHTWIFPDAADNCTAATFSQTAGLPSGSSFPLGTTVNAFTAIDDSGNETSCSFFVTVVDSTSLQIDMCPANIIADVDASGCGTTITWD